MDDVVIELAPWNPWPLAFPALLLAAAIAASVIGTRRRSKPLRESGYVGVVIALLAAGMMAWSMSGIWDSGQREKAFAELGFEWATFTASMDITGGTVPPIAFQGERGGESVSGVLRHQGDDRWLVVVIE
ncbi:hypothetical protein [Agromyces allii]|uniref:Uncharacterized protein n=1 Tax=Agromyces allii TaxID=393607 RepID=A0ABP5C5T8_9MICO|nr:hypothetical protein [Agromyces allii]